MIRELYYCRSSDDVKTRLRPAIRPRATLGQSRGLLGRSPYTGECMNMFVVARLRLFPQQ